MEGSHEQNLEQNGKIRLQSGNPQGEAEICGQE